MCGLIFTTDPRRAEEIQHRGVKHTTVMHDDKFMTHYHLPIQDDIAQPLLLKDGWQMIYNGEIFGHAMSSDTEFLITLFNESKTVDEFLVQLATCDGFWALIIFKDKETIVYTDPLGKKQLYCNVKGDVCSEPYPLRNGRLEGGAISEIGAYGYPMSAFTVYGGVKKFAPGYIYRKIGDNYLMGDRPAPFHITLNRDKDTQLYEALKEAVAARTSYSDVNMGLFVSGGLDSTIIAHHAPKDSAYYTIQNEDDGDYVDLLGVKVHKLKLGNTPIDDIIMANQGPVDLGSMIPQYLLFKAAREVVIVTGDGADELFGGYRRAQYYDSQGFDMVELMNYHLPRIDKMSMRFTKECRNPFLSHKVVSLALQLPYSDRKGKAILKRIYKGLIPQEIIDRPKLPLKSKGVRKDEKLNRYKLIQRWMELNNK